MVVKEVSVDEGEMVLAVVVARGVVPTVSIPMFCLLSRVAWYQLAMVARSMLVSGSLRRIVLVPHL